MTKTIKTNTSELTGAALDWAVAKCEGHQWRMGDRYPQYAHKETSCWMTWHVSTDWAQGGPIIEREVDSVYEHKALECWAAKSKEGDLRYGPTPLIAAMRCYVASKLGDEVEVPEELT